MNASIRGIIDHMFKDVAVTAETSAMHEELLNNCLEHYNDLVSRGMSDTEAIDAVVDSLKGMKEIIDEYPRKPGAVGKEEEKEEEKEISVIRTEPEARVAPEEPCAKDKPSEYVFSADQVRRLRTELKNCDLQIGRAADGKIHVRSESMEQLICTLDGDTLSVRVTDNAKQSLDEAGRQINSEDFSLKSLIRFMGKAIESAVSSITVSWNVYIDIPDNALQAMDLNAKSGDVEVKACFPDKLTIRTMSGDVKAAGSGMKAGNVQISAMSGDIEFFGNADRIHLSSMSGDVNAEGNFETAELKSTSGDARICGTAKSVRLHSVSGDVTVKAGSADIRSIDAHSTSGDADIELHPDTDSVHASVSSVSGSVSCRIPDAGSNALLQITASSVSGDVTVR